MKWFLIKVIKTEKKVHLPTAASVVSVEYLCFLEKNFSSEKSIFNKI